MEAHCRQSTKDLNTWYCGDESPVRYKQKVLFLVTPLLKSYVLYVKSSLPFSSMTWPPTNTRVI